jgi:mannose-6-phosphate isomerase-like protein (cupin superfamily)
MVVSPLSGRTLGDGETSFVVAEWTVEGGPPGPPRFVAPLHLHRNDDEAWYVLEGMLRFRIGDEDVEAPAGSAVMVRRGTPHTFWNPGTEPTRFLLIMAPKTLRLVEEVHVLSDRSPARLREIFARYDSELLE